MNRQIVRFFYLLRFLWRQLVRWSKAGPKGPSRRHPLSARGALQPSGLTNLNAEQFQSELSALETAVHQLRQHFDEICRIQQRQQALNQKLKAPGLLEVELRAIHQQLETLESELMNATLPWQALAEPFWQAIRFGGLGLVAGWFLKGIVQGQ